MTNPYWERSRFRPVDAAWLHMGATPTETPIGGLLLLQDPLTLAQLKALVRGRLLRFRQFRQRVQEPVLWFLGPVWADDPQFNLDAHVHAATLPSPADWAALRDLFEDLMGVPLHPHKPLWQMVLVEQYKQGSALIIRFEHALADGDAAMFILDLLSDADPQAHCFDPIPQLEYSLYLGAVNRLFACGENMRSITMGAFKAAKSPRRLLHRSFDALHAFNTLVFCRPDPQTVLRGQRSTAHRLAVSEPIPLSDIKAVGRPWAATVNDVILSAVAGGFRRYMMARGEAVDDLRLRGVVPVSLRTRQEASALGNAFGLDFLDLPIQVADPLDRLLALKGSMDALKSSMEAQVSYTILHLLGVLPRSVERLGVRFFATKGSATLTNVAGPAETRYLAGSRIDQILFSVPHPDQIAIGMSIMSYDGSVLVTIDTDAQIIPRPQELVAGFVEAFAALREIALERGKQEDRVRANGRGRTSDL